MSEYMCGDCGTLYSFREHLHLEKVPVDPDEENPVEGKGYVAQCDCGYRFHKDSWQVITAIEKDETEFDVSTTFLDLNHGFDGEQLWYETCVFWDTGSRVIKRYASQESAENGHQEIVTAIENGNYRWEPSNYAEFELVPENV